MQLVQICFRSDRDDKYVVYRMRHAAQVLRQVAFLAPKAPRMSSHAESSKINAAQRGAFILFEGGDRCGKTTQSQSLVDHLQASGVSMYSL